MEARAGGAAPTDADAAQAITERRALFAALLADDPLPTAEPDQDVGPVPYVIAVVVAHDGAPWLPETLAGLRAQTRRPDTVIAVDTGSSDFSAQLLARALGADRVLRVAASTGYGVAVAAGLAAHQLPAAVRDVRREWLWLLHDDSAPDPEALERLLGYAARDPGVAVLGPKAVDWDYPDRLVEVGLTTDSAGRRETRLDPYELDQGQHDAPRDVLAVGTAGALIRREAWEALEGFDVNLPLLREDVDFGWRAVLSGRRVVVVPGARIRHVRATLTGRRRRDALPGGLRRQDRAHGLYVRLANAGRFGGLLGLPAMTIGAVLRALLLVATRRPRSAYDELAGALTVLVTPWRLVTGRHRRRRQRVLPPSAARPLLAGRGARLRATLLATTDLLATTVEPAGPRLDEPDDLPAEDATFLRRLLVRPVVGLVLVLTVVGLVADRRLLTHGPLLGGRLLPAPAGARDLWRSYLASWHPGALGSGSPAAPWQPVLAALSLPFGANPALTMTVLMLGAIPLAGLSAWSASRRTGSSVLVRLWVAATYALLAPVTAAVAAGRFDAVVAAVAAPLVLRAGYRLLITDPRPGGWNRAWGLGLGLAVAASFSPPLWVVAAGLLAIGACAVVVAAGAYASPSALRRALAALIAAAVPPLLLLPWTLVVPNHWRLLLVGLGDPGRLAGRSGASLTAAQLLLMQPTGRPHAPLLIAAPVLAAAVLGLLRRRHAGVAQAAVAAAVGGYVLALAAARTPAANGYGWAAVGLSVAAAGLLGAAAVGAHHARDALGRAAFGLRQPVALVIAVAALAVPLAAAADAVYRGGGSAGALHRAGASALPLFTLDAARTDPRQRLLLLQTPVAGGSVSYRLQRIQGAGLGAEDLREDRATGALVSRLVADLASARGTDAAEALATFHVRYVALERGGAASDRAADRLAAVLDTQPALSRVAVPGTILLWRLLVPSARLQLLSGALAAAASRPAPADAPLGRGPALAVIRASPPVRLTAGLEGATTRVPTGSGRRLLVLADSADPRWRATLDGRPLQAARAWGWAQAFTVPTGSGGPGVLRVSYDNSTRDRWLWGQLGALVIVLVLAAPGVRRTDRIEPPGAGHDQADRRTDALAGVAR